MGTTKTFKVTKQTINKKEEAQNQVKITKIETAQKYQISHWQ